MTDSGVKPFKFGVNMIAADSRAAWVDKCRKAEELGYDVIGAADHLGMVPPFPALVLAAEATERPRLNTFVLNVPFYNPVLLARDVTGTDVFTDGRLELGLGAGYVKEEFDAAGMPFPTAGQRVDQLEQAIKELKRLYADPEHKPAPIQKPGPPLLIAGAGDRLLTLAAEHADVIGFTGAARKQTSSTPAFAHADEIAERVEFARKQLNGRDAELNLLCFFVEVTNDRQGALEQLHRAAFEQTHTLEQLAEQPNAVVGTPQQIADQLVAHRERYGFSYYTVVEDKLEAFAPVVSLLSGR